MVLGAAGASGAATIGITNSTIDTSTNKMPNNYARCSDAYSSSYLQNSGGVQNFSLRCDADIYGRYVFVQINGFDRRERLELYEVEVYPSAPGLGEFFSMISVTCA